jgi:hypothetical protein
MRIQNLGLLMYDRMDVAEAADQPISTGESRKEQGPSGAEVPDETIARAAWSSRAHLRRVPPRSLISATREQPRTLPTHAFVGND